MSDTLKLYPPPERGRWEVEEDWDFHRVKLIIRTPGWFGEDQEVGRKSVYYKKLDADLWRKRRESFEAGDLWTYRYTEDHVPRTEDEIDEAIWEASREVVRKYKRKHRPFEYVTEWENA